MIMRFIGTIMTVIDFFCGAGGFSEGFKQMGYEIIYGYDHWKPAVDTFNFNFNLNCEVKNILDFKDSIEEINQIPNTDVIIGSPPCVSFSSSNKSGKADKSLGIQLIESYLRIVAVKKHQSGSILKAWFMENVANSKKYLQEKYTFKDLNLASFAKSIGLSPLKIALTVQSNTEILNSADYGSYQARKRAISGEIISHGKFIIPPQTHSDKNSNLLPYKTLKEMKTKFVSPFSKKSDKFIVDPLFNFSIKQSELTDHFYDSGIYATDAKFSKHWKTNHPYMGRMSFPENEERPSRTITATRIANSRESIIYKSEINRKGNGEYRLPTIREAAIIMGFPITFQFLGSEYTKWRLVGNAVCSSISSSLAKTVLESYKLSIPEKPLIKTEVKLDGVTNLNTYKREDFTNPPIKSKGAKFRWHAIKDGNLTVTLSNYDIAKKGKYNGKWHTSIQYGTGKGFPIQVVKDGFYKKIENIVEKQKKGGDFIKIINNGFSEKIANASLMQEMYEKQEAMLKYKEPTELVDEISLILDKLNIENKKIKSEKSNIFIHKDEVPVRQLFALYAVNKIASKANALKNKN